MSNFIINPYVFAVASTFDNGFSLKKSISTGVDNSVRLVTSNNETTYFNSVFGSASAAFSLSFWIKAGWDNNLNTNIHFFHVIDSGTDSRAQQVRVFFNESNNRLEFRMGENTENRSLNFWPLHSHLTQVNDGATAGNSVSSSNYWSSLYPGGTNSNGFTHLVITKGTGTSLAANNIAAYWNGNKLGNAFYSNGNNFGQGLANMSTGDARTITIGSNAHQFTRSGNNTETFYDELAIFGVELNQDQVTSLYNNGVPQNTNSVVEEQPLAYYRFEGTSGSQQEAMDSSVYTASSPAVSIAGDSETSNTVSA